MVGHGSPVIWLFVISKIVGKGDKLLALDVPVGVGVVVLGVVEGTVRSAVGTYCFTA
jgi:hypothetical protein